MKRKPLTLMECPVVAWTGGTSPNPELLRPNHRRDFEIVTRRLFREQCREWVSFWRDRLPLDIARIFWGRARGDAWATAREIGWAD